MANPSRGGDAKQEVSHPRDGSAPSLNQIWQMGYSMQLLSYAARRLRALTLAAAAVGAVAVPSTASAGTLTVDHTARTAVYTAGAGELNELSFYRLASDYRIQDKGVAAVPLTEIGGVLCNIAEPWKYRCPAASIDSASVSLGDGADIFSASVSSISLTVSAGAGSKKITTGGGADTISARNGSADEIVCGAGADSVVGDPDDVVDASCERIDLGTGTAQEDADGSTDAVDDQPADSPPGGAAPTEDTPTVFETPLGLTVAIATVPVRNETARLRLACAATSIDGCRGDVTLELPPAKQRARNGKATIARGQYVARQRRRGRRLGKRRYRIAPGKTETVAVPVLLRGHYRYLNKRRRSRAIMRITERDAAGKSIDVQTHTITLSMPKKRNGERGQR
jgi:hypothetical protein